ncbi:MAG: 6-pyruvoyl tetrahydrobiopterin synthase [Deltaproteobacteria bacterium RIFCSPLOWO2_02_FULL_50_16]|nr:MAG: 6-pyruvoyl tetrahydrobiopterin synthase [Deltaproteobacteria bacterium GWA2_50_8]OGQ26588.1 MAG: 6-pyruvoyl tetrahydrobiopterin synthase [Deltaproteobacteria bacterium RIFCSPHIGHO2_02_FULL_50_15]OGQ56826.1 MAG: 6-pyruvoyl tetrahydrobiopterin synthase [Deltaproteobacteria bacterium RIFCSPLOWO2_02_FULL_50_16]OGQ68287.1 MAG: 6-pyruvoyl tetrahydrobiopterin synthase [Deltaproteobacteria bacterium RIFCSPLOWO2_12_FULL_50_11]
MFKATKEIYFCYGHRLLNYEGPCKHPHGHNAKADIEIEREILDSRGMVIDFGEIKDIIKKWIDDHLDHKMLLHRSDPLLPAFQAQNEPVYIFDDNPTAENVARVIYEYGRSQNLAISEVRVWETTTSYATYRGEK